MEHAGEDFIEQRRLRLNAETYTADCKDLTAVLMMLQIPQRQRAPLCECSWDPARANTACLAGSRWNWLMTVCPLLPSSLSPSTCPHFISSSMFPSYPYLPYLLFWNTLDLHSLHSNKGKFSMKGLWKKWKKKTRRTDEAQSCHPDHALLMWLWGEPNRWSVRGFGRDLCGLVCLLWVCVWEVMRFVACHDWSSPLICLLSPVYLIVSW